jgi:hypothetical protein
MAKPKELPVRRVTPQKVRAVLRAHNLRPSLIETTASYLSVYPDWGWDRQRGMVSWEAESGRIAAALTAAGIAAEVRDGTVRVPVNQTKETR